MFKVVPDELEGLVKTFGNSHYEMQKVHTQLDTLLENIHDILVDGEYTPPNTWNYKTTAREIVSLSSTITRRYDQHREEIDDFLFRIHMAEVMDVFKFSFNFSLPWMANVLGFFANDLRVMEDAHLKDESALLPPPNSQQKIMEDVFKDLTPEEYAMLCKLAYYNDDRLKEMITNLGLKDKIEAVDIEGNKKYVYHSSDGLDAVLFKIKNTNKYFVVFRGTEGESWEKIKNGGYKDIYEDMVGVVGVSENTFSGNSLSISSQTESADEFMKKAMAFINQRDGEVVITGHSLGGWLTINMADKYQTRAVTFNSPRYTSGAKNEYLMNNNQNIVNFRTDGDPVSSIHTPLDMVYSPGINLSVPNTEQVWFSHGIAEHFRFDKNGDILINPGQGELYKTKPFDTLDSGLAGGIISEYEILSKDEGNYGKQPSLNGHKAVLAHKTEEAIKIIEEKESFESLGDRYIPGEVHAVEIDALKKNKKDLIEENGKLQELIDRGIDLNLYSSGRASEQIKKNDAEISNIDAKIKDLNEKYDTYDEINLSKLKTIQEKLDKDEQAEVEILQNYLKNMK